MKVAAIQMVSGTALQANLDTAARLLAQAAAQGAELAVLPEYFCVMGLRDTDKLRLQETAGAGVIQDFLSHRAQALGLWLVGGTLPMASSDPGRAPGWPSCSPLDFRQAATDARFCMAAWRWQ